MLIKIKRGWEMPERDATPEDVFNDRRRLCKAIAAGPILAAAPTFMGQALAAEMADPTAGLYPPPRDKRYMLDRAITDERIVTTYNNFYEFGSQKSISQAAQALKPRPWSVTFDGMVEKPITIDFDELIKKMPLEERLYRHRCVEAWAIAVPWSGFAMKALVDFAKPLSGAKYVQMETFKDPKVAPGQRQFWYPWPYIEGLTIEEATNDVAFIGTGAYGKPMKPQMGAPIRLVTPWKYGFKSIKSIVRFTFTDKRPLSFWQQIQASEYGFWANVNPDVPHPRWSQANEKLLGSGKTVPTQIYNGYGEFVAHLYDGMKGEKLFM